MKSIVWISPYAPYDSVNHAGGQNHNYFLKYIHKKGIFNIKLLTLCNESEQDKLDLSRYGILYQIGINPQSGGRLLQRKLMNIESTCNPYKYAGGLLSNYRKFLLKKLIRDNCKELEHADIIIFQWTEALLVYPYVKKICGMHAKIFAIEEDVAFLGFRRKYELEQNRLVRWCKEIKYSKLRKAELDLLQQCDKICCVNVKDQELLCENGISPKKIIITPSHFTHYSKVCIKNIGYNIVFFGNMKRRENWDAALWFIDNVMELLPEQYMLYVIGANPVKQLKDRANERIKVTGFVLDISEYLENSLCMVAPLLLGAGLKIKVLEGMSAGKVVLTNSIGIEGIPAQNGETYIHCDAPQDYVDAITHLHEDIGDAQRIGNNARNFVNSSFNTDMGLDKLIECMEG